MKTASIRSRKRIVILTGTLLGWLLIADAAQAQHAPIIVENSYPSGTGSDSGYDFGGGCQSGNCAMGQGGQAGCMGGCTTEYAGMPSILGRLFSKSQCGSCRFDFFGEYLYLRSRDAEVAYAETVDGPVVPLLGNGIQMGPTAVAEMDYSSGFRAGVSYILQNGSRLVGQMTNFDSSDASTTNTNVPLVIRSLVTHPLGNNAAADGLQATANYSIDFDLADFAYHSALRCADTSYLEYFLGIRYAHMDQKFGSTIDFNGTTDVNTNIQFDGTGPRFGLYGEQNSCNHRFHLYGRGEATFAVGSWEAKYQQTNALAGGTQVASSWESGRIVSLLDTEIGFGWTAPSNRFRITCGYMVNAWFNSVKTDEYIKAVRENDFTDLGDLLSFDGLVIRGSLIF